MTAISRAASAHNCKVGEQDGTGLGGHHEPRTPAEGRRQGTGARQAATAGRPGPAGYRHQLMPARREDRPAAPRGSARAAERIALWRAARAGCPGRARALIAGQDPIAAATMTGVIADAVPSQHPGQPEEKRARRGGPAAAAGSAAAQAPDGTGQPGGRPAKRRAPGGGVHPVVNAARLNTGRCPQCGKNRYPSRAAARKAARILSPGRRLRVYQCGEYWHLTSIREQDQKEPSR
jgi:hypothetical protein